MNMILAKFGAVVSTLLLIHCNSTAAESVVSAQQSVPKPSPSAGERGTIAYWQTELKGKAKHEVKALLGTPSSIAEQGAVYCYPAEFFHPDLDQWRDILIRFSADDSVESFTGAGNDTKVYSVGSPTWQEAADVSGIPLAQPSPAPTPDLQLVLADVEASTITIQYTESSDNQQQGSGATGFLVEHNNKTYVVTNIHVLEGEASTELQLAWHHGLRPGRGTDSRHANSSRIRTSFVDFQRAASSLQLPEMKTGSGSSLTAGSDILFSDGKDIALIPTESESPKLQFSTDSPVRGRRVIIVGNSGATHTMSAVEAEISNVGPDRFELDRVSRVMGGSSGIEAGMSGSAVVDLETKRVLGVVTYGITRAKWVGDNVQPSIVGGQVVRNFELEQKYFAYRCDNLSDLTTFKWSQFVNDCLVLHAIRERTLNVLWASNAYEAAQDASQFYSLTPDLDNKVEIAYSSFVKDASRFLTMTDNSQSASASKRKQEVIRNRWQEYQRKLETLLQVEPSSPTLKLTVPWFIRELNTTVAAGRRDTATKLRSKAGFVQ